MVLDELESPGHVLAARLEAEIRASQAEPGTVVASLSELQTQSKSGRPVVKQAVRILEERGIAFMRRGAGGGLVVAAPSPAFASRALSINIEHEIRNMMEVGPLPMAIDTHLYVNLAPGLDMNTCEDLRKEVRRLDRLSETDFIKNASHLKMANAIRTSSGDPMMSLVQQASQECSIDLIPYILGLEGLSKKTAHWEITKQTVEALIASDPAALFECRRLQISYIRSTWDSWERIERDPSLAPSIGDDMRPEFQLAPHRADRLVREILREVRILEWLPGARIGSGVELMERYHTGPDIVRQAVLILKEHGVVEVEKGRKGGLYITAPDRAQAISASRDYLKRSKASYDGMKGFMVQFALHALDGFPDPDPERLKAMAPKARRLAAAQAGAADRVSLWRIIEILSDNRVFSLFCDIMEPLLPSTAPSVEIDGLIKAASAGDLPRVRRLALQLFSKTQNAR